MPRCLPLARLVGVIALLGAIPFAGADAQIGGLIKRKAEEAAKKRLEERMRADSARQAASEPVSKDRLPARAAANYDFTPGTRAIFATNYAADRLGNFPRQLKLVRGNMDVAEVAGTRMLQATSDFDLRLPLPETLPERFTVEFDVHVTERPGANGLVRVYFADPQQHGDHVICSPQESGIYGAPGYERKAITDVQKMGLKGRTFRCRIMVDDTYGKVYVDETRVANHPDVAFPRTRTIALTGEFVYPEYPLMIGDIRVAGESPALFDELTAKGRVATYGITFETGSDRIRPESMTTLKEIGEMLESHPDLRLAIEGHTDNVGDEAANRSLSAKRAVAVRLWLIERHRISAGRLIPRGLGSTRPIAPNTTPEGRQANRRVELVKN